MISNNTLDREDYSFKILIFFSVSFVLRVFLSLLNLGGGDAFNAADFYALMLNSYDYYTIHYINSSPPPYLPFTSFIYYFFGFISENLNLNFNNITKLQASITDLFIGLIIFFCLKQLNIKKAFLIFVLYIFNPLTIYITSQLGFLDSLVILLLILCCYISDNYKNNTTLIPFLLILSFCIKPFTFIFFPYFFLKFENKLKFLIISFVTIIFFNIHYFIQIENTFTFINLSDLIFKKVLWGHQTSFHGLGLIRQHFGHEVFNINYIKIIKLSAILLVIILNLFFIKKIKSYKFIFINFFIIFLTRDNLHFQYFVWIVPFVFLFKFRFNVLLFCFFFFLITFVYSIYSSENANGLFLLLNQFNTFNENPFLNENVFLNNKLYLIFLFYFSLIILINYNTKLIKKIIKKIFLKKMNLKEFLKFYFSPEKKKKKINFILNNKQKIVLLIFILSYSVFIFQYNSINQSTYVFKDGKYHNKIKENNFKFPNEVYNFKYYGEPTTFKTKLGKHLNNKDTYIFINTDYYYELFINDQFVEKNIGKKFDDNMGGKSILYYKDKIIKLPRILYNSKEIELKIKIYNLNFRQFSSLNFVLRNKKNTYHLNNFEWEVFDYENKKIRYKIFEKNDDFLIQPHKNLTKSFFDNITFILSIFLFISLFNFLFYLKNMRYLKKTIN